MNRCRRIVVTPGEPAGIGPDLMVKLAQQVWPAELVVCADPQLLLDRAAQLGVPLHLRDHDPKRPPQPQDAGTLTVLPVALPKRATPGVLNPVNSPYVLESLDIASHGCLQEEFDALITGPVHKGVINDAGYPFSGHTEYLAQRSGCARGVMLLVAEPLRVALATTHLPLSKVPAAITQAGLTETITLLVNGLQHWFGIKSPCIYVCGLNPHAGEGGHLGDEELTIIGPTLEKLRDEGLRLTGPLPADTLFQPHHLRQADAVLAMYHDQGLPVLKSHGFGRAVNVTLGLPFIRTSVDHGTALALAGRGSAHIGSMVAALQLALKLTEPPYG